MKKLKDFILKNDKKFVIMITLAIFLVLCALFLLPGNKGEIPSWISHLPLLNAILSGTTFSLLILALIAILRKKVTLHERLIYCAFTSTLIFFISYITYHSFAASTSFGGEGALAVFYYVLLISHIFFSTIIVPLALISLLSGIKRNVKLHRKLVRFTMPIWLYVSFTGILVYILISPYYS